MTDSVLHQTIQNLEGVLPTLEEQERHLRNQLDDVVQRATSARSALEHLRVLTGAELADRQPVAAGSVSAEAAGTAVQEAAGDNQAADAVAAAPVAAEPETEAEPAVEASVVPQPRTATSPRTKRRPAKKAAAAKKPAAAKPKAKKAAAKRTVAEKQPVAQEKESGSLLDAALDVLKNSGAPMRPRDINEALGRESTPGQIESVRNTLDRAVKKTDLVTRPGRGTYAAA
ncbi:hypothetical protein [Streptomyces noursei]|uniref:hypothetical protein n=1 Tax=Streptomyces noursei TaxID=1971 RepID=UPI001676C0FB|nr:hypothetical protein [Streptomyces noursei]MCZ1020283.1 hypothetical protein [Streptomyces noursei]GGX41606.1 hypothetical protein GCM10010341_74490 [Streptomyces noursei]